MDMPQLLFAVRRQISDVEKSFLQTILASGDTNRFQLDYSPVKAESLLIHINGKDFTEEAAVEEHTGTLIFDFVPDKDAALVVAGQYGRFFTDDELQAICEDAVEMHIKGRSDHVGRPLKLGNLEPVEDIPVQILCSIQALYVLLTDSSYDIDINAPDGVQIPRSQRFRQMYEMLAQLELRYRELSAMLDVGMYALETFTFRRVSKRTNRYVPVWRPQEIDDRSIPKRVHLPIPSYGGKVPDDGIPDHDITLYRGDTFKEVITVEDFIPENARLRAHIRRYRGAWIIVAEFGVTRIDEHSFELTMPANRSEQFPDQMVYDVQMETAGAGGFDADFGDDFEKREIKTLVGGHLYCPKDVTVPRMTDYTEEPIITPVQTGPHYSPTTGRSAPPSQYMYGTK